MLQQLVSERAKGMYSEAAQRIREVAVQEANKLGLGHSASTELMKFAMSDDPKVPEVVLSHLMRSIVSSLEVTLGAPEAGEACAAPDAIEGSIRQETGYVIDSAENPEVLTESEVPKIDISNFTQTTLKAMSIEALREIAEQQEIQTKTPEGKNVTRKDLEEAILAKKES